MTLTVVYFAWVRERIGRTSDSVERGDGLISVTDLVAHLRALGPGHAAALADIAALRFAIDDRVVGRDAPLAGAHEVAIFPPMTGGGAS